MDSNAAPNAAPNSSLHRKIDLRLLPYLFVLYVVAYLDRVNVSFAAGGLTQSLGFTSSVFGLGAGMFFAGYVLCEVPSNLILRRVGARLWIARIMATWGLVACGMALVHTAWTFHALRFLLGVAEAGFLPGIIYYLTLWYAPERRAHAVALFMAATPVAGIIGAPLSGALLEMHGIWGLEGWRWMFVLEGVPAVLLGFSVLRLLPDGPADARWLSGPEREALASELAESPEEHRSWRAVLAAHAAHDGLEHAVAAAIALVVVSRMSQGRALGRIQLVRRPQCGAVLLVLGRKAVAGGQRNTAQTSQKPTHRRTTQHTQGSPSAH